VKTHLPATVFGILILASLLAGCSTAQQQNLVVTMEVKGTITASTAESMSEALSYCESKNAEALVLLMDTPGGMLDATETITKTMQRSKVPVVVYIHPVGAKGWSAGTFILLASHVAAMAPHTIIGSAQPVQVSPTGGAEPVKDSKIINALVKTAQESAKMHGRNETAAKLFITENLNLNDEEAYKYGVVEIRASNLDELQVLMDGRAVKTTYGEVTMRTKGATVTQFSASLRVQLMNVITNPILASTLFTIGIFALVFGLSSPGYGAEVVGAVALILGLIGIGLDINIGAALLVLLGAVLMVAEAYTPGFGILGGAGLVSIVVGSLLLVPFTPTKWMIAPSFYMFFLTVLVAVASTMGAFTLFMVYKIIKARRRKPVIGDVVGETVTAVDEITPNTPGFVRYKGEYWQARSNEPLKPGEKAEIIGKDGPVLIVKLKKQNSV